MAAGERAYRELDVWLAKVPTWQGISNTGPGNQPLDFISCVQHLSNSWISSGSTSLRVQASSQWGFGGGAGTAPFVCTFFFFDFGFSSPPAPSLSLLLKALEKKPIVRIGV